MGRSGCDKKEHAGKRDQRGEKEDRGDKPAFSLTNETIAASIIERLFDEGVQEVVLCPGGRNQVFVDFFGRCGHFKIYTHFEERAASFFALGLCRAHQRPVCLVTTSGTAVTETYSAVVEAHYSMDPLVILSADRPLRERGTNAPQTIDQEGLFQGYAASSFEKWDQKGPLHINVPLEEPSKRSTPPIIAKKEAGTKPIEPASDSSPLTHFLASSSRLLVIVGPLTKEESLGVLPFLLKLNAPVYLEAHSKLREKKELQKLALDDPLVPFDKILVLGRVPTTRVCLGQEKGVVLSVSASTYSGGFGIDHLRLNLKSLASLTPQDKGWNGWRALQKSVPLTKEEMIYSELSETLPHSSLIYLGNSTPIRFWDQAATKEDRGYKVYTSRGANGIDGQISTFFGLMDPMVRNICIVGDLTALYDLSSFWITRQLPSLFDVIVINNRGGQIFKKMFENPLFLNTHQLSFAPLAAFWGLDYEEKTDGLYTPSKKSRLIEIKT